MASDLRLSLSLRNKSISSFSGGTSVVVEMGDLLVVSVLEIAIAC